MIFSRDTVLNIPSRNNLYRAITDSPLPRFASNGTQWQHARALVRPHLTKDSFVDAEMSRFEKHFGRLLSTIPKDGSKVDLQPLFFSFTLDAAIDMLTGQDLQSSKHSTGDNITKIFDNAQRLLAFHAIVPFGGMGADEKRYIKLFHNWVDQYVNQAIDEHTSKSSEKPGNSDAEEKHSFLQKLVKETDDAVRIRNELISLLMAGRDTTASALSSLFFILAKRPDVVTKLQVEVAQLGGERPGFLRLKQMHYFQHTIQECSLRSVTL